MKIALIADPHFKDAHDGPLSRQERTTALCMAWIERFCHQHKPDTLVVLGDLFERHGNVNARVARQVQDLFRRIAVGLRIKVVLLAGNHDYADPLPGSFGKSLVSVLFEDLEALGIHVVCARARFVPVGARTYVLGIPYRKTEELYRETCHDAIVAALAEDPLPPGARVIPCMHAGLPFGARHGKGDEDEHAWVTFDNPMMRLLHDLSHDGAIYMGHYHRPYTERAPDGSTRRFTYVGSLASVRMDEAQDRKRALILDQQGAQDIPTGLEFHCVTDAFAPARAFVRDRVRDLGEDVLPLLFVHGRLHAGATHDDHTRLERQLAALGCNVRVDTPLIYKRTSADDLIEQYARTRDRRALEKELALRVAREERRSGRALELLAEILGPL